MKKFKLVFILMFLFFLGNIESLISQSFQNRLIPSNVKNGFYGNVSMENYVNSVKYLPKGYSTKGDVDYTQYIQQAIDENPKIVFPNFPVLINENGLKLNNNTELYFQRKSAIFLKPNKLAKYHVLLIEGKSNIKIYNPTIIGDRNKHLDSRGEWGMGISIYGGQNVNIINPKISSCWGDGLYISSFNNIQSTNIKVQDGYFDNNRRNAISVISVNNLTIENTLVSNSNGIAPMSGICIEPNSNNDVLSNINIRNVKSFNNVEYGLAIVTAKFIGEKEKNISINVENFEDRYSKNVLLLGGTNKSYPNGVKKLKGFIKFNNIKGIDNIKDIVSGNNFSFSPQYEVKGLEIQKNGKRVTSKEVSLNKLLKSRSVITN